MPRRDSRSLIAAVGLVAFAAVYALDISTPRYFPLEGEWAVQKAEGMGPGMGWYARSAWGLGAGLVAAGLTAGFLGIRHRPRNTGETDCALKARERHASKSANGGSASAVSAGGHRADLYEKEGGGTDEQGGSKPDGQGETLEDAAPTTGPPDAAVWLLTALTLGSLTGLLAWIAFEELHHVW